MKKLLLSLLLVAASLGAGAQSANELYNKYAGKKDVSAVYISPAMFKMMKSLPDMDVAGKEDDLDISSIVENLEGMYVIEMENARELPAFKADVDKFLKSRRLELLLESKEEDELTRIYVCQKGDVVSEFVVLTVERDEADLITFTGKMKKEDLSKMLGK